MSLTASIYKYSSYLMLFPGLILCILFLIMPLAMIVNLSFYEKVSAGEFVLHGLTIQNYIDFIYSPQTATILINTFGSAIMACALTFVIAYPLAYFLTFSVKSQKVKAYLISILIVPFLIDWNIRTFSWIGILGDEGIINYSLNLLGLIDEPLGLYFSRTTLYLIWLQTYVLFMEFPIYLALNRIDPEIISAAKALKAPPHKVFYNITFKLSLPGVITGWIFVFVSILGDYITPMLVGRIQTLGLSVQNYTGSFVWPYAATLSTILIMIALAVLYILLKIVDIKKLVYER